MRGYDLSESIIIEYAQEIKNAVGGFRQEWREFCECWAKVESLFNKKQVGNEIAFAKEIVSANFYQFTIWFNKEINVKMRLIWDERVFEIVKIIDSDPNKRFMQILAKEIF